MSGVRVSQQCVHRTGGGCSICEPEMTEVAKVTDLQTGASEAITTANTPEGKPPESVRAAVLRHLTVIRERLSKHYRDDVLWAAIQSAEEAVLVEPIEAERDRIAEQLYDAADRWERKGGDVHKHIAVTLIEEADKIREGRG